MVMPGKAPQRFKLFYGWYVVAAVFAILFFNAGARFSFGVMFKPMIAEFGWSRGTMSLVFFLNMALYALSLTAVGKFYDRYGPKWVISISTVFLAAGYILMAAVNSLWQFYLFYGILAAIGYGGTSAPLAAALTSKWFKKWRGFAISLALSGGSLGQFALIPLFTIFTLRHGWRASYLSIGVIMLVVNIVLALLVIRGDSDDLGVKPFGHKDKIKKDTRDYVVSSDKAPQDLGLREAMRTYSFWLFLIVMFICGSGDFLVTTHLIPLVTDYGISPITAGNMLAWFGLMSLAGILIAGPASDLIGNKIPIALTFLIRVFLFLMILKYQNLTSFYVFALVFGLTHLITAPLTTTLIGRMYGLSHIGLLSGFITTVHHLGGGVLAYMGGMIFDKTGSYQLVFIISTIMAFIATIGSMLIAERRHRAL
jgi:MFS family permease